MMSFAYDSLLLDLLIDLAELNKSRTCFVSVPKSFQTLLDDRLFEAAVQGGEVHAMIDGLRGLELNTTVNTTRKAYGRQAISRQEAAAKMVVQLWRVHETWVDFAAGRPCKLIDKIEYLIDAWRDLQASSNVNSRELKSAWEIAAITSYLVYRGVQVRPAAERLLRFERRLATLKLAFRVTELRYDYHLRLCFVPVAESEVLRRIASECRQRIKRAQRPTRKWFLSLWERTRQLDSPAPEWLEEWHDLILCAEPMRRAKNDGSEPGTGKNDMDDIDRLLSHLRAFQALPSHRFS